VVPLAVVLRPARDRRLSCSPAAATAGERRRRRSTRSSTSGSSATGRCPRRRPGSRPSRASWGRVVPACAVSCANTDRRSGRAPGGLFTMSWEATLSPPCPPCTLRHP
jgi:hypothetical protein